MCGVRDVGVALGPCRGVKIGVAQRGRDGGRPGAQRLLHIYEAPVPRLAGRCAPSSPVEDSSNADSCDVSDFILAPQRPSHNNNIDITPTASSLPD